MGIVKGGKMFVGGATHAQNELAEWYRGASRLSGGSGLPIRQVALGTTAVNAASVQGIAKPVYKLQQLDGTCYGPCYGCYCKKDPGTLSATMISGDLCSWVCQNSGGISKTVYPTDCGLPTN